MCVCMCVCVCVCVYVCRSRQLSMCLKSDLHKPDKALASWPLNRSRCAAGHERSHVWSADMSVRNA